MRGTSRGSLQGAADRFEPVLTAAGVDAARLGEQMFALVDALEGSGSLRRTLTDPSIPGEAKAGLARRLLADADPAVADVVADLVSQRWSAEDDLTEHRGARVLGAARVGRRGRRADPGRERALPAHRRARRPA
jgi:F-type H+-transporting ATPase subunit delta